MRLRKLKKRWLIKVIYQPPRMKVIFRKSSSCIQVVFKQTLSNLQAILKLSSCFKHYEQPVIKLNSSGIQNSNIREMNLDSFNWSIKYFILLKWCALMAQLSLLCIWYILNSVKIIQKSNTNTKTTKTDGH